MTKFTHIFEVLIATFSSVLFCTTTSAFLFLSIPVYMCRLIVMGASKWCRPDLGEILNGQSSMFASDYFSKKNPRSNVVITFVFEGQPSFEGFRDAIVKKWVLAHDETTGELLHECLQQYPTKWFGFTFWKKANDSFNINNHYHLLHGKDNPITHEKLTGEVEKLLNSSFRRQQSPWEAYVIQNYKSATNESCQFVLLLKLHHCLSDGYGILSTLVESIFQIPINSIKLPEARFPERSHWQALCYFVTLPINLVMDTLFAVSHQFRSSPWKLSDEKKQWYQVCAKAKPIPIQVIKDIKNAFGVSFPSVLLTAISAAVHKTLGNRDHPDRMSRKKTHFFRPPSPPMSRSRGTPFNM